MPPVDGTATLTDTALTIGCIEQVVRDAVAVSADVPVLRDWSFHRIGEGQGFCANIFRVQLAWQHLHDNTNGHRLPASVVVKVPTPANIVKGIDQIGKDGNMAMDGAGKDMMKDMWIPIGHKNEVVALRCLNAVHEQRFAVPKLYMTRDFRKDMAGYGCLVMEDYPDAVTPSIISGISVHQLQQITTALARIQAATWEQHDQLSRLTPMPEEFLRSFARLKSGIGSQLHAMAPEFGFDQLVPQIDWIFDSDCLLSIARFAAERRYPVVMSHGDLWANNILVAKNEQGAAAGDLQALIDWQTAHAGFVVEDLGRLLVTSTLGDTRRRETDNVLRLYLDELRGHLTAVNKPCELTFDIIKEAYDFNFPYAVAFYVIMIPMMATSPAFVDKSGKLAPEVRQVLMSNAKMAMEDVLELRKAARC